MIFENNSTLIYIESWFIPLDILMIICTTFVVVFALIFLSIIILDKTCHTIPMMLIANSCLAEFIFGIVMFSMVLFTFENDLKQIEYQDSFCIFRGFIGYVVTVLQNYSYLLQAIYRYITVVYPNRLFWQSARIQAFLICFIWILGFLCPIPYVITGEIKYNVDNQICQMPLRLSFLSVYNALIVYMIPISLIIFIYFKLIRYIREMSKRVTPVNTLFHAQRELKMVRRIVILVIGIATIGFPYAIFLFVSYFTTPPKYHFRIAYIFVDVSLAFVMIAIFKFTEPLKISIMKKINGRVNMILPAIT
jgi:hypothetical protein